MSLGAGRTWYIYASIQQWHSGARNLEQATLWPFGSGNANGPLVEYPGESPVI